MSDGYEDKNYVQCPYCGKQTEVEYDDEDIFVRICGECDKRVEILTVKSVTFYAEKILDDLI